MDINLDVLNVDLKIEERSKFEYIWNMRIIRNITDNMNEEFKVCSVVSIPNIEERNKFKYVWNMRGEIMNKVDKINEGIVDLKERKLQMTEDNIHKLELVKEILTISKTDIVTVKMCAEYFEVNERRIRQVVDEIKEELEENGLKVYSKAEFLKEINVPLRNDQQLNGKSILTFEDGTELVFPNRGLILMTKRTVT